LENSQPSPYWIIVVYYLLQQFGDTNLN